MNSRAKAEEFFETIIKRKKSLIEIPRNCSQGETGTLLYLTYMKDGIAATELSDALNVSLPRIISVINSLESKKLVEKLIDKYDKSSIMVYLKQKEHKSGSTWVG